MEVKRKKKNKNLPFKNKTSYAKKVMDASLHCSNAFIFFFYLFMTVIKESVIFNKDSH